MSQAITSMRGSTSRGAVVGTVSGAVIGLIMSIVSRRRIRIATRELTDDKDGG